MTRQRLQQALRAEARAASEASSTIAGSSRGMIKDWKTGKTGDLTLYRTALETMNEIYGVPEIARSAVRNLGQDISSRVTYYDPRTGTMESGYIHRDNIQRVLDYAERNRLPEPTMKPASWTSIAWSEGIQSDSRQRRTIDLGAGTARRWSRRKRRNALSSWMDPEDSTASKKF